MENRDKGFDPRTVWGSTRFRKDSAQSVRAAAGRPPRTRFEGNPKRLLTARTLSVRSFLGWRRADHHIQMAETRYLSHHASSPISAPRRQRPVETTFRIAQHS